MNRNSRIDLWFCWLLIKADAFVNRRPAPSAGSAAGYNHHHLGPLLHHGQEPLEEYQRDETLSCPLLEDKTTIWRLIDRLL